MKQKYQKRIALAAGKKPVTLLLKNCKVVNVFTQKINEGDLAIDSGKIVGMGEYEAENIIDMEGKYVAPGLIDSHQHMESSLVTPRELAKVIVPRGTTTIIADPHEIANVCGLKGIEYMMSETEDIPLNVFFMMPSCVPATQFEKGGAILEAKDIAPLMSHDRVLGLGELMDYPAVIEGREDVIDKVLLADRKMIDGHGPLLTGKPLNAYRMTGVKTDHECTNLKEMEEKLDLGMYISIREGTAARDLENLIQGVNEKNLRRVMFCTDDKHPGDILLEGHIDHNIRKAIQLGIKPIQAIQMATLNPAECYQLRDIGAIAPGYDADLIVLDDLEDFKVTQVYKKGILVADHGKALFDLKTEVDLAVVDTVRVGTITEKDLQIKLKSDIARVIRMNPKSLLTNKVNRKVSVDASGHFIYNPYIDILKMAVIDRYGSSQSIGLGLIENFNLQGGAIGTTIAHDSHNLIVVGDNDKDMILVIETIKEMQGGVVVVSNGNIVKKLPLPVAGLMSTLPMEDVAAILEEMTQYIYQEMNGNPEVDPLMSLSFLALPVIPEIKLTDKGLFDVNKMCFISVDVEG